MDIRAKLRQSTRNRKRQREVLEYSEIQQEENDQGVEIDIGNEGETVPRAEIEEVEFEEGHTNKGRVCLWNEGFRYTKKARNYWNCSNKKCAARAKTKQTENGHYKGRISGEHYHGPELERKEAEKKRKQIKDRMKAEPRAEQGKVLAEVRNDAELEVVAAMGTDNALKMMIYRQKKRFYGNVNTVNTLQINLPDALLSKDEHNTLLYDSRTIRTGESDVVFVFSHPKLLDVLRKNRQWALDGTLKAAPKPFTQCFCIGAFIRSRMVVCAQCLVPSKRQVHLEEMLTAIKNAIHPSIPSRIITSFEKSEIDALKTVFPDARLTGCLFHFGQSLYRKWKELGLDRIRGAKTEEGHATRESFRRILALPLIPAHHVRRAFGLLTLSSPPILSTFLAYFASVYIGQIQMELLPGQEVFQQSVNITVNSSYSYHTYDRPLPSTLISPSTVSLPRWEMPIVRPPQYSVDFWNVHDLVATAIAKTNETLESSHPHLVKNSKQQTSMSDYLHEILEDVDKQWDISRTALLTKPNQRKAKYVIKEQEVMGTLGDAMRNGDYDDDGGLLNVMTLLGLQMLGFVSGLNTAKNSEEGGTEDGQNSSIQSDIPSTSNPLNYTF